MADQRAGSPRRTFFRLFRFRKGATAVEFALLAFPFFALTLGALEISLMHLQRSSINSATQRAARTVLTGSDCIDAAAFKATVCEGTTFGTTTKCSGNTRVLLQELASFDAPAPDPSGELDDMDDSITQGDGGSIMLLRVYHRWNTIFPFLDDALGGGNGGFVMSFTHAFRTEPYGDAPTCGGA